MRLSARALVKSFGDKQVLKGISFEAEPGKALGLLGRNGAGKTTAIRVVMGVFPADDGEVLLDGRPIDRGAVRIGYLPEERGLYAKRVIEEQLVYFAMLRGLTASEAKENVSYWLERVEMGAYARQKLDTLSKGNQQKIQLAATLLCYPDVIILDEPFSGLDPVNAKLLKDIVKEQLREGKTVFFSSHQMNYIEEFCEQIAIIKDGAIAVSGAIRDIRRGYARDKLILSGLELEPVRAYILGALRALVTDVSVSGEKLEVTLAAAEKKNDFMSALVAQEFDLDGIQVYEPTLSDIFVQYTEAAI